MATPRGDAYAAASGATVYGGRTSGASWAQGLAVGQWVQVPTSNTLASLNPNNNAALNPNFPALRWNDHASIVTAWNGACFDRATDTLWLPCQGGHGDYSGNEPYRLPLRTSTPTWQMLRAPSGAIGNNINLNDGQEATGLYSDGRIRSPHSYNWPVYVPGRGPVLTLLSALYASAGASRRCFVINETTGEASELVDWRSATQAGMAYGGGCWDSARSRIFALGDGMARPYTLDLSAGTATPRGAADNIISNYLRLVYCTGLDVVVGMSNPAAGFRAADGWSVFDPASGTDYHPGITGSFAAGFDLNGQVGMEWDGSRLLLWNQSSNTAQVSTLTPPASPLTQPWVAGSIAIPGANTVTPSARTINGTYGRWAYSPNLGGCFLLNSTSGPVFFVRTN